MGQLKCSNTRIFEQLSTLSDDSHRGYKSTIKNILNKTFFKPIVLECATGDQITVHEVAGISLILCRKEIQATILVAADLLWT